MIYNGPTDPSGWYRTLQERFEGRFVDAKVYNTRSELWSIITTLLPDVTSRLHIPHNDKEYVLRRSDEDDLLFFPPYNPVIFTDKDSRIVGVLSNYKFAARAVEGDDTFPASFIPDELEIIAKDPVNYFETMGQLYGKCLVCGRGLKREESIERAMGPVCYNRVTTAQKVVKETIYSDVSELAEIRGVHHSSFEMSNNLPLLTYEELNGLSRFNATLEKYYRSGFHIGPTGALLFGKRERYPAYILPDGVAAAHLSPQVALRPVAATDYNALSASLIRQGVTTLYFDKEAAAIVVPHSQYAKAKIANQSIIKTPPPAIEPLRQSPLSVEGEDTQGTDISTQIPVKSNALFQWNHDRSEMLLYHYPTRLQSTLRKIPGVVYDRIIKRLRVPVNKRGDVENLLNLKEVESIVENS